MWRVILRGTISFGLSLLVAACAAPVVDQRSEPVSTERAEASLAHVAALPAPRPTWTGIMLGGNQAVSRIRVRDVSVVSVGDLVYVQNTDEVRTVAMIGEDLVYVIEPPWFEYDHGPSVDTSVVVVHDARFRVTLAVGSKDGVEVGLEFTVYRDGEYITTVVVDHVRAKTCSARVKSGLLRKPMRRGDLASTRL